MPSMGFELTIFGIRDRRLNQLTIMANEAMINSNHPESILYILVLHEDTRQKPSGITMSL